MNLPDKCPFCEASVHVMEDGKECRSGVWVTFDCHTSLQTVADPRRFQSSECEVRERLRLAARVAELEAENKSLRDRFSDADTERNAAQGALKAAFARLAELERDLEQAKADRNRAAMDARNPLLARVAELEARCKRLTEAARAVYLDSIASDHLWSTNETRNMHALRDVLEAKP